MICLRVPRTALLTLGLAPLLCLASLTVAARSAADDSGVQVLTRGPVHEAFAAASMSGGTAGIVIPRAPYEAISEMPPDQRPEGDDVAWIPGYWSWDDDRTDFIWVSGVWRDLPPGRQWVPGYWATVNGGSQWISGFWGDVVEAEVTYLPPPPEPLDVGPSSPQPGPGTSWAPGCWIWQQTRYDWQPGYWVAPQPQWVWSPAHYTWTPRGHIYVPGYWDHDLGHRGVIFAPVYYDRPVYARPNYYYSPTVIIDLAVIATLMFVQPRSHQYYFGDYYDRRYEDRGYYPWHSRQAGRYGYDPLFVQYRAEQLRNDRDWDVHVEDLYRHRQDHPEYRPPQTLALQINIINQGRTDGRENLIIGRNLADVIENRTQPQRFAPVGADERGRFESRGREVRKLQSERASLESTPAAMERPSGDKPTAEPARVRMPRSPLASKPVDGIGRTKTPPAAPATPAIRTTDRRQPVRSDGAVVPPRKRQIPIDLGQPNVREVRRTEIESAPRQVISPRRDSTDSPRKITPPRPQVEQPRKSPEPKTPTVAPRQTQVRPPAARVESMPQREPFKAKRPKSSEKREQAKPRRGPVSPRTNTSTNIGK